MLPHRDRQRGERHEDAEDSRGHRPAGYTLGPRANAIGLRRMRAMVLSSPAPIETSPLAAIDGPIPEPGAGEVRVRVRACGACRTDLHVVEGELAQLRRPLIPGHQVVGTVDSLGPGATRFGIGDRIGIAWLRSTCGRCRFCVANRENLCERSTYTGWTH